MSVEQFLAPDLEGKLISRGDLIRIVSDLLDGKLPADEVNPEKWKETIAGRWYASGWEAPECYFRVIESMLLGRIRAGRHRADDTSLAARLWARFAVAGAWSGTEPRDEYGRWFPVERDGQKPPSARDAFAVLDAIEARRGASYSVPFPVVGGTDGSGRRPDRFTLIECRVSRLRLDPGERLPGRVVLAPWSEFLLWEGSFAKLISTFERCEGIVPEDDFLLEFAAVEGISAPESSLIVGNSLDLAALLAALSSGEERANLYPFVATGEQSEQHISRVGELELKRKAVVEYARARRERVLFLIPPNTALGIPREDLPWIDVRPAPASLRDLVSLIRGELGDGCDSYRDQLELAGPIAPFTDDLGTAEHDPPGFLGAEIAALGSLADRAAESGPFRGGPRPLPVGCIPFGESPTAAARHVAWTLIRGAGAVMTTSTMVPLIPLPFPLDAGDPTPDLAGENGLIARLRRGLGEVFPAAETAGEAAPERTDLIREDALSNLLRHFHGRLLLIAYDRPSRAVRFDESDRRRVTQLIGDLRRLAPGARAVLVASDGHHEAWLTELEVAAGDRFGADRVETIDGKGASRGG